MEYLHDVHTNEELVTMMSYLRRPLLDAIASSVGRALIVYLFVGAASWHLRPAGWAITIADMANHGVPAPAAVLIAAMAISSVASLALLIDWETKLAAYVLAGYTIVVSSVLHNPFHAVGDQFFLYVKDLGIAGTLLVLASVTTPKNTVKELKP